MGQKSSKKSSEMTEELLNKYVRSEFRAMDTDHDSTLSRQETLDLLILLGYSKGKEKLKALHVKNEDTVELEDYVTAFLADKTLVKKTQKFRILFQIFDNNKDGTVTKDEMVKGLEDLDIEVDDQVKKTIQSMDANHDGKITYEEFLTVEFKIALNKDKDQTAKDKEEDSGTSKEEDKSKEAEGDDKKEEAE